MYKLNQEKLSEKLAINQDFSGKKVLLRTCLNVTVDADWNILDNTRLLESLPCIKLLANGSKQLIITAHLGRPKSRTADTSFAKVCQKLSEMLGEDIYFADNLHKETIARIKSWTDKVVFLENIRYFAGEDSKEESERQSLLDILAGLADVFVNDAFADYRKSVSNYYIAEKLPSFVWPLFATEISKLTAVNNPDHPFVAIIWWSKLSEKIETVRSLCQIADKVFVAGGIATTILRANWLEIWTSLCENDKLDIAKDIYDTYSDKLVLPVDFQINKDFANPEEYISVDVDQIPSDMMVLDQWPKTIQMLQSIIADAKTIVANGTVWVYEFDNCSKWSRAVLEAIADNTDSYSLIWWWNTLEATNKFDISWDKFDHVSTGWGAMLAIFADDKFVTLDVILNQ